MFRVPCMCRSRHFPSVLSCAFGSPRNCHSWRASCAVCSWLGFPLLGQACNSTENPAVLMQHLYGSCKRRQHNCSAQLLCTIALGCSPAPPLGRLGHFMSATPFAQQSSQCRPHSCRGSILLTVAMCQQHLAAQPTIPHACMTRGLT